MTTYTHTTLVCIAAQQAVGQAICAGCMGEEGEGMLVTGLSPTGASPATHYISSGDMESTFAAALREKNLDGTANSGPLHALCIERGMEITQQDVGDFLETSDVSDAEGKAAIDALYARLGGLKKLPRTY